MPAFFLAANQITALNQAIAADATGLDELRADYGPTPELTLAQLQTFIGGSGNRALGYRLTGQTVRGILLAVNTQLPLATGTWEIARTVVQKSLTDAQRIQGFREMVAFVAAQFPSITITGIVKAGGKLDTFLTPKDYNRTMVTRRVVSDTQVTGEDGITTGTVTYADVLVRHSALASVVAATI